MPFYLQHYFDPDFDFKSLRPTHRGQGNTDLYNMGYAQNVSIGHILAEIVPLESVAYPLPRFILQERIFPSGPNTHVDPEHPQYLLSSVNGYVFYYEGRIVVKRLLNVRSDVDFHTGNIFFVGDAVIHKDIKAGFTVEANNVLINGIVEGGEVRARKDLQVEGGARGGASDRCLLSSGGGLKVSFVEKVELRASDRLIVDRFAVQATIYARGDLIVNGLITGGVSQVTKYMLVKGNIGNKALVTTKVHMGYDPFVMRELEKCETRLAKLTDRVNQYQSLRNHATIDGTNMVQKLESAQKKRGLLLGLRDSLWKSLRQESAQLSTCRLIVLGTVYPGVEISIGRAFYAVSEPMSGVYFRLKDGEVVSGPVPQKVHSFFSK